MANAVQEKEVLLKVENLCQFFKLGRKYLKAVNNISFEIHKGEVFGLVGESGCGKTTTGRSIIKLHEATGGNVYFKGRRICAGLLSYKEEIKRLRKEYNDFVKKADVTPQEVEQKRNETATAISQQRELMKEARADQLHCDKFYQKEQLEIVHEKYNKLLEEEKNPEAISVLEKKYRDEIRIAKKDRLVTKIQMIFQDPIASLNPRMTVKEIISEGLIIKGIKDKEYISRKVFEVLDMVGLVSEHATRYPHEFSGGQRQRIGVARSIIMQPEMIIADEPVSALDVSIQAQVINLLNDLRRELGLTILFIAHDLSVIKYFSDRIGVMYYGNLVEMASSNELFKHPLHPYTRSLLSAIPLPDPLYEKKRRRITYNPVRDHNYAQEAPTLQEIVPGHFVMCNSEEFERYTQEIKKIDNPNS